MSRKTQVPDAWDDDWVDKADKPSSIAPDAAASDVKLTKAERRAKQEELNRKLWEEAEAPKKPFFIEARSEVPLKSEFKPAVKVLSRKPPPSVVARRDPISGLEKLVIEDDEDDEEEDLAKKTMTMEERQLKAQREREEKQKKYEEARERILGDSQASSGVTSPGNITPPAVKIAGDRGRGKGRSTRENRIPASTGSKNRQLYDPNYTAKPDSPYLQKKESQDSGSRPSTPAEEFIIRSPRGPDGSGRGGFGFANRGGKMA